MLSHVFIVCFLTRLWYAFSRVCSMLSHAYTRVYPSDFVFFAVTSVTPLPHCPETKSKGGETRDNIPLICCHKENNLLSRRILCCHKEKDLLSHEEGCCHKEKKWLHHCLFVKFHFTAPYYPEKHHFRTNR